MPGMPEDINDLYGMMSGPNSGKVASKSFARSEPQKKQLANSMSSKKGSLQPKEDAKHDSVETGVRSEGLCAEKCKGCGERGDESGILWECVPTS